MAMAIATIGDERTLTKLAQSLFVIQGPGSKAARLRAESALLRANPSLAEKAGFTKGAVVFVPAGLGLKPTARVEQPDASAPGLLEEADRRLRAAGKVADEGFLKGALAAKDLLAKLDDDSFKRAILKQAPGAEPLIPDAMESAKKRIELGEDRRKQLAGALEKARAEVETLQKLAKKVGGD